MARRKRYSRTNLIIVLIIACAILIYFLSRNTLLFMYLMILLRRMKYLLMILNQEIQKMLIFQFKTIEQKMVIPREQRLI